MRITSLTALGLFVTAGILASCASNSNQEAKTVAPAAPPPAQTATPANDPPLTSPLTVERSASAQVTAKIVALDYNTRRVTLQDPWGYTTSFIAGQQVQRLNELHVDDTVVANYTVSLVAELRPATAEESASPITTSGAARRASEGADPGASASRTVKVVTTVDAIDLPNMLVTLRGPMGDTTTVRARSADNIKKLHLGDTIVITYTDALAVSVTKAGN